MAGVSRYLSVEGLSFLSGLYIGLLGLASSVEGKNFLILGVPVGVFVLEDFLVEFLEGRLAFFTFLVRGVCKAAGTDWSISLVLSGFSIFDNIFLGLFTPS